MINNIGIYKIICNITKLVYIGYSTNLKNRKSKYISGNLPSQPLIKQSILNYGWGNHKFEIIEECQKNQLKNKEIYWIKFYDSYNNGLNSNCGGGGPISHTNETKNKISKSLLGNKNKLGFKYSNESKEQMRINLLGKPSRFKNHKHSENTKIKMRLSKLGKSHNHGFKIGLAHSQEILCLETNQKFNSLKEASKYFNISLESVRRSCNKKITVKNLTFKKCL